MKVVVNVKEVFYGLGRQAKRYRRGDIVEITEKKIPAWAIGIEEAVKKEAKKTPAKAEPKTLSEMNKQAGPEKAFGQEI